MLFLIYRRFGGIYMRGILGHRSVKLFSRLMAVLLFCMVPVCGLSLFSNFREQIQLKQTIIEAQERNASYTSGCWNRRFPG